MRLPISGDVSGRRRATRVAVANWASGYPTFTPLSLAPTIWLDAADTSTIIESSGLVSQWNDKSGNGNNVTQGTSTARPVTNATKINGLNVLDFNGAKGMRSANGVANDATLTVFVVANMNASTFGPIIGLPQAATTHIDPYFRFVLFQNNFRALNIRLNGTRGDGANNTIPTQVASFRLESDTGDAFVNSTRVIDIAGVTLTYPNSVPFLVGENAAGGERIIGSMAEILLFSKALTYAQTQQIENYLTKKWNLAP